MRKVTASTVELIDSMGSDLTVVNAARVSFDKESTWETPASGTGDVFSERLGDKDTKLINYLAKHNHWSPFAHTSIQLRIDAPIFVARQLVKHSVGMVWNEVSRRYVDDEPVFYFPFAWRGKPTNAKQGSDGFITDQLTQQEIAMMTSQYALDAYKTLLGNGAAPEQARMVLPQNMMTSWYWTGSLMFFHRVYAQRINAHAQYETQEVALQIGEICAKLFPVSWKALNEK